MALGMELGFSPGGFVLDEDRLSPHKGAAPNFRPTSVVAKRLHGSICHLGTEVGIGPDVFVFGGDPGTPTATHF